MQKIEDNILEKVYGGVDEVENSDTYGGAYTFPINELELLKRHTAKRWRICSWENYAEWQISYHRGNVWLINMGQKYQSTDTCYSVVWKNGNPLTLKEIETMLEDLEARENSSCCAIV